jgi:hypothetical protein
MIIDSLPDLRSTNLQDDMIDFDLSVLKVNEEDLPLPKLIPLVSHAKCSMMVEWRSRYSAVVSF